MHDVRKLNHLAPNTISVFVSALSRGLNKHLALYLCRPLHRCDAVVVMIMVIVMARTMVVVTMMHGVTVDSKLQTPGDAQLIVDA